jgi:hypothetical protein
MLYVAVEYAQGHEVLKADRQSIYSQIVCQFFLHHKLQYI